MADDVQNADGNDSNPDIKALRDAYEENKTLKEQASQADLLARENAFLKAGVDVSTKAGELMMEGYDGELTADAIKAFAAEVGFGQAPSTEATQVTQVTQPADTPTSPGEAEAHSTASTLEQGATPPSRGDTVDPRVAAIQAGQELLKTREESEAMGFAFNQLVSAGIRGDQRVIIKAEQ